jgi:ionotropic glutamate receptor
MRAIGLIDIWTRWYQPDVRQCLNEADKITKTAPKREPPRLSRKNLTGAFVVLLIGYLVSFLVFLVENIFGHRNP